MNCKQPLQILPVSPNLRDQVNTLKIRLDTLKLNSSVIAPANEMIACVNEYENLVPQVLKFEGLPDEFKLKFAQLDELDFAVTKFRWAESNLSRATPAVLLGLFGVGMVAGAVYALSQVLPDPNL